MMQAFRMLRIESCASAWGCQAFEGDALALYRSLIAAAPTAAPCGSNAVIGFGLETGLIVSLLANWFVDC